MAALEAEVAILAGPVAPVGATTVPAVEVVVEDEPAGLVAEAVPVGATAGPAVEAVPVGATAGPAVEAVPVAQVGLVVDPVKAVAQGSGRHGSRAWFRIAVSSTVPSAMNGATTAVSAGAPPAPNGQSVLRGARLRELPG